MFLQFQFERKTYCFEFLKNNLFTFKWVSGSINVVSIKFSIAFSIAITRKMKKEKMRLTFSLNKRTNRLFFPPPLKCTGLLRAFESCKNWMDWVYQFAIIQAKLNVFFHWTFYFTNLWNRLQFIIIIHKNAAGYFFVLDVWDQNYYLSMKNWRGEKTHYQFQWNMNSYLNTCVKSTCLTEQQ